MDFEVVQTMEDLLSKVQEMLDSPEKLKEFQNLAATLLNNESSKNQISDSKTNNITNNNLSLDKDNIQVGEIENILQNLLTNSSENKKNFSKDQINIPMDLNMILKIKDIAQVINQDDRNIEFLKALKLLLGNEKQQKIDDAIKIMRLIRLIPIIKDSGIFKSFLF